MSNKILKYTLIILCPLWIWLVFAFWLLAVLFFLTVPASFAAGVFSAVSGCIHFKLTGIETGLVLGGISLILIGISLMLCRPAVGLVKCCARFCKYMFSCFKRTEGAV